MLSDSRPYVSAMMNSKRWFGRICTTASSVQAQRTIVSETVSLMYWCPISFVHTPSWRWPFVCSARVTQLKICCSIIQQRLYNPKNNPKNSVKGRFQFLALCCETHCQLILIVLTQLASSNDCSDSFIQSGLLLIFSFSSYFIYYFSVTFVMRLR